MSEYIRDITSEHLGPMGSDNDARLTRAYLLAHGWKATDCIRDVDTRDWEDAVLSATESQKGDEKMRNALDEMKQRYPRDWESMLEDERHNNDYAGMTDDAVALEIMAYDGGYVDQSDDGWEI